MRASVLVVKEGDTLVLGGPSLKFHQTPGHTPGVLTTEGITVYDGRTPFPKWVKRAQNEAEKSVQLEKQKAGR